MFKKIVLTLLAMVVVVVGGFAAVVALQSPDFRIERSTVIAAPPATVHAHVNDFHKWDAWSPWKKLDPNQKNTYEGPSSGQGAILRWSGNDEVGEGSMTILESKPAELVRIKLDFLKPMENTANVDFAFVPEGDKTKVTWTMSGKNNFIGRAMCMFMNMDKMVGGSYEEGLANMKAVIEKAPTAAP